MKVYETITDLLSDFGASDLYGLGRSLYKAYDFGPWVEFLDSNGDGHSYEDRPSLELPDGATYTGIRVGSIVEGSDAEPEPIWLDFPFVEADLDRALSDLGDEVDFYWRRDNIDEYVIETLDGSETLGSFEVGDDEEQDVPGVTPEQIDRIIDHLASHYVEERDSIELEGFRITRVEKSWYTYF
jgi:hypothetical protein